MTLEAVQALIDAMPDPYRALVTVAAGTGLRQGEVSDSPWTGSISSAGSSPLTGSSSRCQTGRRTRLRQGHGHRSESCRSPRSSSTPWPRTSPPGRRTTSSFTTDLGTPIRRTAFSERVWRPAVKRAGLSGVTPHSLRHFYASPLIRHGESVKTVRARLGHASAAETLDTYSHLWPDSDDRTRAAVDSVMRGSADSVRTEHPL